MELFDGVSSFEEMLVAKADMMNIPIGGTMELLPLCNMDCKMCYIHMSLEEMKKHGQLLSCDEWLKIAQSAKDAGVLFLLITGGEPLLYPDFKKLYTKLTEMGFIITINTNGTLIDEEWADFFASRPCRRLNITLYGKDDETYHKLCRNPKGFTQVSNAAKLLIDRNVPFRFNFTCTPYNIHQLSDIYSYSKGIGIPLYFTTNLFPPVRKEKDDHSLERLTPKQCAKAHIDGLLITNPGIILPDYAEKYLKRLEYPLRSWTNGNRCRAAISGFWINWHGQLLPCGMFSTPHISLLENTFIDAWKEISSEFRNIPLCMECETCKKRNVCSVCFANCVTETGKTNGKPQYLCDVTDEKIKLLLSFLSEEQQKKYKKLINDESTDNSFK